ncbi:hypothetical protein [Paucibacter sp. XJ19-41]|uniref:hypothetical protein n=1 Tax=Paucibacter sp. XJ19-41 TaxID=2927824 RepID=UPI002349226E|nr:hypothetical protein [Paucibacter sp. XJ19-41]MDC6167834.1 hypothetical protein [Paucibacter sp. XJ19-41]
MDNSDDKTQAPYAAHGAPGQASAALSGRRRLLRGGLIGAPALLALKSSPVLACNCKKPSGFSVSGNLSRTGSKVCLDPGKKPSVWAGNKTYVKKVNNVSIYKYNGTQILSSTLFTEHFAKRNEADLTVTFAAALAKGDNDVQAMAAAVYLEALAVGGPGVPRWDMVRDMWNQAIATSAGYQPVSSHQLRWYSTEVVNYLKYLTNNKT